MSKTSNKEILFAQCDHPIKILQFGEGNFLRAFVGDVVDQLNQKTDYKGGIAVVQPIEKGLIELLEKQGGAYTLFLNGIVNGNQIQEKKLIQNIVKTVNPYADFSAYLELAKIPELEFICSNTTEAGIEYDAADQLNDIPQKTFPAKLTRLLWERFTHFKGDESSGLYILPCELINYNATSLKKIVLQYAHLWELDTEFINWIENANTFCNTLVDRIVPGYPKDNIELFKDQLDYDDALLVTAEPFFLWVIEGDEKLKTKLKVNKIDLDIKVVENLQSYRTQKVRILNGAHTALAPLSLLYGHETVSDIFTSSFTKNFLEESVRNEIAPTLEMDKHSLNQFTEAVFDRFKNPFIKHYLASIALNSISKFKVRVLPSLLAYQNKNGTLPPHLVFSFACLLQFYQGNWKGKKLPLQDDEKIIEELQNYWDKCTLDEFVEKVLSTKEFWDQDLTQVLELAKHLQIILKHFKTNDIESSFTLYIQNL